MERKDLRPGMQVVFGSPGEHAEKSYGEIVKVNSTRAKVKLLEQRGTKRDYPIGTMFVVPFCLIEPVRKTMLEEEIWKELEAHVSKIKKIADSDHDPYFKIYAIKEIMDVAWPLWSS